MPPSGILQTVSNDTERRGDALDLTLPRDHPLFGRVDAGLWARTLEDSELLQVDKGDVVYAPGRFRRCLGVVLRGRVEVRREALLMAPPGGGGGFGAAAPFAGAGDYPTTLTALIPCKALLIPQESVRRLLRQCGPFAEDYAAYLSGRIQFLSQRLEAVSAPSNQGKLARYLLSAQEGGAVTLSATQLCQRLGVGRATLYRAFDGLERAGAIAREGKTIRVLRPDRLEDAINEP